MWEYIFIQILLESSNIQILWKAMNFAKLVKIFFLKFKSILFHKSKYTLTIWYSAGARGRGHLFPRPADRMDWATDRDRRHGQQTITYDM